MICADTARSLLLVICADIAAAKGGAVSGDGFEFCGVFGGRRRLEIEESWRPLDLYSMVEKKSCAETI